MRSNIKYLIFVVLIIFIFAAGSVSASDFENATITAASDDSLDLSAGNALGDLIAEQSDAITVNNWNDLQVYCSKSDKNYVLKLKEDTNYYPTNPDDESYQIQVNNNVTIIGSSGAYFGDDNSNAQSIKYLAINVPENSGNGITLKGVTFKWISVQYQPNAVFLQMAGNSKNYIENCYFTNSNLDGGHSSLVCLMRGYASLTQCTFINVTSDFGCVSVYDPDDIVQAGCYGARMDVTDSYFEGNYARTEPGCINNCGQLVVRNSTFYKNTAAQWAGAIHTHSGANTTIYDSNFISNLAGWNGGALYTYSYLQIYNTIFIGNNCTTNNGGGAIGAYNHLTTPHIYIKDSLFKDNENLCWGLTELSTSGTGRGGAISVLGQGTVNILNNTFIKNSASIGTAICVYAQGQTINTDVTIIGNRFINHTRTGDVLVLNLNSVSTSKISDNYYFNNSIEFSKLKLTADESVGDKVTIHIDANLRNENYYDSDILDKSDYNVYVDGKYFKTITGKDFTLDLKNLEKCQVYIAPSISNSKSNEVSVGTSKEYIYVSQRSGNDNNNGTSRQSPVATIAKACELARASGNILIMDGSFSESNIQVDYKLTIKGEDGVKFTGTLPNTIFTVSNNSDFTISNVLFDNIVFTSKNTGVIRQSSGYAQIVNCQFNANSVSGLTGTTLIEAKNIEVYDSKFTNHNKNNVYMMLIKSDEFLIDNCTFINNIASQTSYPSLITTVGEKTGLKGTVTNSIFKSNKVKYGCINFDADSYPLTITNVDFIANEVASANDYSSCIKIAHSARVNIDSCTFSDNVDLGKKSAAIYVEGGDANVFVSNSIILNNAHENEKNAVFSASNLDVYKNLSTNWWGNTWQNYTAAPIAFACDNWLFLNASANATSISKNQKVLVTFDLNNLVTKGGTVSSYDANKLGNITFNIKATGGEASDSEITLTDGVASTTYTLTSFDGTISAEYNGYKATLTFSHAKTDIDMFVTVKESYVGEPAIVEVEFGDEVSGKLTINGQTKDILGSKTTFELNNLPVGENVVEVSYSGDEHWYASAENVTVNVNKLNSTTKITLGDVELGKDVGLTIEVTESATGNVILFINGEPATLTLTNSKAEYTIKSIARGNYNITAVYNGDSKYLSSKDEVSFGVGRVKPTISVDVLDIAYGQDAIVNIVVNSNATGNVNVNAGGKNKTAKLENGKVSVSISGLSVGPQTAHVSYNGDDYYGSANSSASFNVLKADTTLFIKASDIKVGASEIIEVSVPNGVTGNITIICGENIVTKAINAIGKVTWTVSDLSVGSHEISATLISDNYNSIENTTEFTVFDYSTAQWPNQGYDIGNDGKSPYESDSNGAILWTYNAEGMAKNIVIDSEGNVLIVTSSGVYSISSSGKQRWNYDYVSYNISGLSISREVVIIPIEGNSLFFVNQTTGERYGYSHIYQASSLFAPVTDSNSNIYVSSEYQNSFEDYKFVIIPYSLWEYGGNPILISLGKSQPIAAPVLVGDNYAVIACSDGIKIIDLDKKEISSSISGNTHGVRPVAGSGNIVYTVFNNNIQAMTPQGNVIWKTPVTGSGGHLALDEENGLYFINSQGNLYKYDVVDGSEKLISSLNFTSGILIGGDGNLYMGSNEMLYAFDNAGNVLWKSDMGDEIVGTPVMDENGIIYLTTSNALKAIGKADLADANVGASVIDINIGENASVMITLGDDLTGEITVEIDSKNYTETISQNNMIISVPNLSAGHKTAKISYSGDNRFNPKEISCDFKVFSDTQIIAQDANSYYGSQYVIALKDAQGNAIVGEKLTVLIGDTKYNLTTNKNGEVSIKLDMSPGDYQASSVFSGNDYLKPSNKTTKLKVLSTILSSKMTRGYNSGVDFKATFLANDGSPLSNKAVSFIVNGVIYNTTTDKNGVATLNCNLNVGGYEVSIINLATGESTLQELTIAKRITNNNDLTMDYLDGSAFKVRVVGDDGKYVGKNEVVSFKISGKTYTAKTDANGYASLKINLVPKTYSVTAEYKGYKASNKIVVKQVLKAKNVSKKKAKSYKFQATLKTSKGKAISGKKLTFKIKNKKYTAKTNKKGVATITIKINLKVGKYTITTTYSKTSIKNKLTIKK
ncbi:Ig-like domain repeat protein [uncultured Methanobrevibacter sp.]|uniref:Ig-like domain repeat protein n=1 Tax=uncultured Methanobrevibacter sp. TaxID=253161 RepID=UPI002638CE7B|nr:Ig-like domain repeat protein [uncultured Methanobrevibacter sp.]